jgi:nucleoside-diphosphate-sugar epimerase
LAGVQTVVHLAARVHVLQESAHDPLEAFRIVNVEGTRKLAMSAMEAGVKRIIFISSIGVDGAETFAHPYNESSCEAPHSPYALSKWEAEKMLRHMTDDAGMEVVVIRPPLVYGPGAPGNFKAMLQVVAKGIPLPLGAIHNRRSFVALDNLVDLIITCIDHPNAANQNFLVSDGEDLSTTELLQRMAAALGKPARLLPVPLGLLKAGAMLLGKRDIAQRLLGSLQVDISKTKEVLGWLPPVSVDEALKKTAEDFLARSLSN